jgi:hypothetical protein
MGINDSSDGDMFDEGDGDDFDFEQNLFPQDEDTYPDPLEEREPEFKEEKIESSSNDSIDLNGEFTDETILNTLSESLITLERLLSGSQHTKDNLEKIFEIVSILKSSVEALSSVFTEAHNFNQIAENLDSFNDQMEKYTNGTKAITDNMFSLTKKIEATNKLIAKGNSKNIANKQKSEDSTSSTGDTSVNLFIQTLLFTIVVIVLSKVGII